MTWAVVTGASGGLGEALAREVAKRGHNLVLVARSEVPMNRLAVELRSRHHIEVEVEAIDLSVAGSALELCARLNAAGIEPDVLINNAAFGMGGELLAADPARMQAMLQLNIITLTELTQQFGKSMKARGGGKILLVGSVGAYVSSPLLAAYAASKAYVLSLGEALHVELGPTIGLTVLTPGIMDTGFGSAAGFNSSERLRRTAVPTGIVAKAGIDALLAGRPNVVVGVINRLVVFSSRLLSRSYMARAFYRSARSSTH